MDKTMSEDKNEVEEEVITPVEEIPEPITDEVEDVADDIPTVEDYMKLKREAETLKAQKDHWRKKAEQPKVAQPETNKQQNDEALKLIRDEAILFAKGYTEDEVALAVKVSKLNGVSMLEAISDDYVKAQVNTRLKKEKAEKASLGVSSGTGLKTDKPVGEMTEDEHRKLYDKVMGN